MGSSAEEAFGVRRLTARWLFPRCRIARAETERRQSFERVVTPRSRENPLRPSLSEVSGTQFPSPSAPVELADGEVIDTENYFEGLRDNLEKPSDRGEHRFRTQTVSRKVVLRQRIPTLNAAGLEQTAARCGRDDRRPREERRWAIQRSGRGYTPRRSKQ